MALFRYPLFYCVAGIAAVLFVPAVRLEFWPGIIALGAMISLYGWINKGERNHTRYDTGDNCYFIGFVYTLAVIALSVGLDLSVIETESEGGVNVLPLLKTVGIALGTSVIGMLWRFGLTHGVKISKTEFDRLVADTAIAAENLEAAVKNMGYASASAEEAIRRIEDASGRYADKMREESGNIGAHLTQVAGKLLDDFGTRVADALQKTEFDLVREELQKAVEHHREAVLSAGELLRDSAGTLNIAAESASVSAQNINNVLNSLNESITAISANIQQSANQAMSGMEAAAIEQIRKTSGAVENAMATLQEGMNGDKWSAISEAADSFAEQAKKISEGLDLVSERQKTLVETMDSDVARLRRAKEAFDSLIQDLRKDAESAAQIKEEYRREFQSAANAALEETHRLYAKLIQGAEAALSSLENPGGLSRDLREIARQLETVSSQLRRLEK